MKNPTAYLTESELVKISSEINKKPRSLGPRQLTGMKDVGKGIASRPHSTMNSDSATLLSIRARDLRPACSPSLEWKPAHAGAVLRVKYTNADASSWPLVSKTLGRVRMLYRNNCSPTMSAKTQSGFLFWSACDRKEISPSRLEHN